MESNYDDSVTEAARAAEENGWIIVPDTSWPGYERIPQLVMQGYTALLREALSTAACAAAKLDPRRSLSQFGDDGFAPDIARTSVGHGTEP